MIYIEDSNIEIIMLKNHMEEKANTNKEELENMKIKLKRAMNKLSENERIILNMYYFDGKKEHEIAKELGRLQPSIARTKNNAIRKLKDIVKS